ncbi:hypothetical protein GCM10012319_63320 [Comamonas sp. KCTC 72670]|nr:hypothetical protein GCM10012319_63320 [Comamonas sp. KCTC 72670]
MRAPLAHAHPVCRGSGAKVAAHAEAWGTSLGEKCPKSGQFAPKPWGVWGTRGADSRGTPRA